MCCRRRSPSGLLRIDSSSWRRLALVSSPHGAPIGGWNASHSSTSSGREPGSSGVACYTAHHRTQLTVYLRMMGRAVPATYGPTADVMWEGADATHSVDAAGRK
jgi:hypothetical protein